MTTTKPKPVWAVGDALVVGPTRWGITALNENTERVQLKALSTTNHGMTWTTTLDRLPEKRA